MKKRNKPELDLYVATKDGGIPIAKAKDYTPMELAILTQTANLDIKVLPDPLMKGK